MLTEKEEKPYKIYNRWKFREQRMWKLGGNGIPFLNV
jgi:hypothetical protein